MPFVLLFRPFIVAESLDYSSGVELLKKINETPAALLISYTLCSSPKYVGYRIEGVPRELADNFVNNPDDFVVEA